MAVSTTTSTRASEAEGSHTDLNEPSMEDILASIRRIIAEDQSNSLGRSGLGGLTRRTPPVTPPEPEAVPAQAPEALSEPADDISSSTALQDTPEHVDASHGDLLRGSYAATSESLYEPAEPAHDIEPPAHTDAAEFHEVGNQGVDHRPTVALSASDHDDDYQDDVEPLISPVAGASITSSFQTLAESVMLQDPGLVERIMRETLRPMLKMWLDDHLPSIVERLVRAEIERVARGGRSRD